jgi:hypothetical protein
MQKLLVVFGRSLRAGLYTHTAQALASACTEALEVAGIRYHP